tara:strand:+ start:542 stop:1036 length:495 start_codon:yes stop_codon:yes gene_type:complete
MAHFAKLGKGNIVEEVIIIHNNDAPTEEAGLQFIKKLYPNDGSIWKQTSYNTSENKHLLGGTPFRKNFAIVGGRYDQALDAFLPIKRYDSWLLNETTYQWEAPIAKPSITTYEHEGNQVLWDLTWNERVHQEDVTKVLGWQGQKATFAGDLTLYNWNGSAWVLA